MGGSKHSTDSVVIRQNEGYDDCGTEVRRAEVERGGTQNEGK